jgi:signal transduction histidine kinase
MNLIDNANQHAPVSGSINLGSELTDRSLRFWVRDTGKGIEPADQAQFFERFARAAQRSYRSDSTGLGLTMVQAMVTASGVTASGGRVELESYPGVGSTFSLVLPRTYSN